MKLPWSSILNQCYKALNNKSLEEFNLSLEDFVRQIEKKFTGDIARGLLDRLPYATDNSVYERMPDLVVYPRCTEDVSLLFSTANEYADFNRLKFTARGGGTGTNGQSLNTGVIIDYSRHMNRILEINAGEKWVRCQPGAILENLQKALKPMGLFFSPAVSPGDRATLGGMVSTDGSGEGSLVYGKTSDRLMDMTLVLADGTVANSLDKLSPDFLLPLKKLLSESEEGIRGKLPQLPRRFSGYNITDSITDWPFSLKYLLAGSEGTLAQITELKLEVWPLPLHKKFRAVAYSSLEAALIHSRELAALKPVFIETLDDMVLSRAREELPFAALLERFGEQIPGGVNLVEWNEYADTEEHSLEEVFKNHNYYYCDDDDAILWRKLRKKGVELVSRTETRLKPVPLFEDTAVPPQRLPEYIVELKKILQDSGLTYALYGHADAGCIHVRPLADLILGEDREKLRKVYAQVLVLLQKYGGILWGEHGKGLRSPEINRLLGPDVQNIFNGVKKYWDPAHRLNPGKLAPENPDKGYDYQATDHWRYIHDEKISGEFHEQMGGALLCNGNGFCFNENPSELICPTYRTFRDRAHSPKGRAVALRHFARGDLREKADLDQLDELLEHCIGCAGCKTNCPVGADIPGARSFYYRLRNRNGVRLFKHRLQLSAAAILHTLSAVHYRGFNWFNRQYFDNHKSTPVLLAADDLSWLKENRRFRRLQKLLWESEIPCLILPPGGEGKLAGDLGLPFSSKALISALGEFISVDMEYNLCPADPGLACHWQDKLIPELHKAGFKIKLTHLHQLITDLMPFLKQKQILKSHLITELKEEYFLLVHCHEQASGNHTENWVRAYSELGIKLNVIKSGCCGQAGIYGYIHPWRSRKIFESEWGQAVDSVPQKWRSHILATGISCRKQLKRCRGIIARHPIDVLLDLCSV